MAPSPLGRLRIVWHALAHEPLVDVASQIAHSDAHIRRLEYQGSPQVEVDEAERERTALVGQSHSAEVVELLAESERIVTALDRERAEANKHKLSLPKSTAAQVAERDQAFRKAQALADACEAADAVVDVGELALQRHLAARPAHSLAHARAYRHHRSSRRSSVDEHEDTSLARATRQHWSALSLRQRALYFGARHPLRAET